MEWCFEIIYFVWLFECGGVNVVQFHGDGVSQFRLYGTLIVYLEWVLGVLCIFVK